MPQYSVDAALMPFLLIVALLLAIFWIQTFITLMSMPDDDFPGQHARFGWVAAFVVLWVLAPIAFVIWRRRSRRSARDNKAEVPKGKRKSKRIDFKKDAD